MANWLVKNLIPTEISGRCCYRSLRPSVGAIWSKDTSIPAEHIETMRQASCAANADAEIIVYPEAGHAFNADYRPSYHAESAQDGWQRMLDWFTQHGVSAIPIPEETHKRRESAPKAPLHRVKRFN